MTIAELNAYLQGRELALPNMGGFDGQTVAGVISTSTHGSGIAFGPLSDFVRSLDIVAAGGTVYRIEPDDGPSDPEAYRARLPQPSAPPGRPLVRRRRRGHGLHGSDPLRDPGGRTAVLPARGARDEHLVAGTRRARTRRGARAERPLRADLQPLPQWRWGDRMPRHHAQPDPSLRIPSRPPPQPQPADGTGRALSTHPSG